MNADKTKICDALLEEFKSRPAGANQSLALVMTILLKHTADMLEVVVEAVAEKYGHSADEMMEVVKAHPKFTGLAVDPALHDLAAPVPETKKRGRKKLSDMTPEERATHEARVAAKREAKKSAPASPASAAAPSPPLEEIADAPVPAPAPVKRVFTIKPKKKVEAETV
jgi:hypothetical protein